MRPADDAVGEEGRAPVGQAGKDAVCGDQVLHGEHNEVSGPRGQELPRQRQALPLGGRGRIQHAVEVVEDEQVRAVLVHFRAPGGRVEPDAVGSRALVRAPASASMAKFTRRLWLHTHSQTPGGAYSKDEAPAGDQAGTQEAPR